MDVNNRIRLEINEENYGALTPYIIQDEVTDLDYNGRYLWVGMTNGTRKRIANIVIKEEFVEQFTHRIANLVNQPFNQSNVLLEAETKCLRISILHESVAISGRSISIRKSPVGIRMSEEEAVEHHFCDQPIMNFLVNGVISHQNIVFCGEPGVGKTECVKFFSKYIPEAERIITIEDNLELHFEGIYPERDCVSLKVSKERLNYEQAIKASLRQNPAWIILSEARSREVKYLLEVWSTGVSGFTTLHTDDVRKIPDRIQNMMEIGRDADRLENQIFEFVRIGVLIRRKMVNGKNIRMIDQVGIFYRDKGVNSIFMVAENGILQEKRLPAPLMISFERAGIRDPFERNDNLKQEEMHKWFR